MKKISLTAQIIIFCLILGGLIVYFTGRPDIPNRGRKTDILSFQNLSSQDYSQNSSGYPIIYRATKYRNDPKDSCTICNESSMKGPFKTPCSCGMPAQIYYSQINWPDAILDWFVFSVTLFIVVYLFSWVLIIRKNK